jgi:RNA polymerase sigma-70 factor, ECF subfamily
MSDMSFSAVWRENRPYLVNLTYQILGDVGEAEDVAQEAFLRLNRADEDIENPRGWLTVVASRLCLDQVRSARARRESPGDLSSLDTVTATRASAAPDPADRVTLDDEVRGALMEVLQVLSPGERVAFVLHDVFQLPFETIAETVGRPVGTCRQLARRARSKIELAQPARRCGEERAAEEEGNSNQPARRCGEERAAEEEGNSNQPRSIAVTTGEHQQVAEKFIAACGTGDLAALAAVLDPTVWGVGTVLADPAPPPQINHGTDAVARNLLRYLGRGATLVSSPVGGPVVLGYADRHLFAIVVITVRDGLIVKIDATADPAARGR